MTAIRNALDVARMIDTELGAMPYLGTVGRRERPTMKPTEGLSVPVAAHAEQNAAENTHALLVRARHDLRGLSAYLTKHAGEIETLRSANAQYERDIEGMRRLFGIAQ